MAMSIDQTAGVKVTTQHVGIGRSAVGRSGQNKRRAQCLTHVSKWPLGFNLDSSTTRPLLGVELPDLSED
jgi:hypothetical protein